MIHRHLAIRRGIACVLVALFVCTAFTPIRAQDHGDPGPLVERLLAAMTLEERVGQMFMVSITGEGLTETGAAFLREMTPGAVAMFASNGVTPGPVVRTINAWQRVASQSGADVPLIIAIDHEGGPVTRLADGFTALPWGPALGAMPTERAKQVGEMAATELKAVGIRMNLAPVADVRTPGPNGGPSFMERRAFGPDPARVAGAVAAYVQGLQGAGVIAALKHFPGHGSAGDSHRFLPTVESDRETLDAVDLAPFKAGIEAGADVVMVAHLIVPALDPSETPASLSAPIIQDVLRGELGFEGVVMTDAMDMAALTGFAAPERAAVLAVQAGIDLLATGPHFALSTQLAMRNAVLEAVAAGQIDEARIDDSARRILTLKARYGLLDWSPLDPEKAAENIHKGAHDEALFSIYRDTAALVYDYVSLLPISAEDQRVGLVYPGLFTALAQDCGGYGAPAGQVAYSLYPTGSEIRAAAQLASRVDLVVIFTYDIAEHPRQAELVNSVPQVRSIVVALSSPYDLEQGILPMAYLATFNPARAAFRAACGLLFGQFEAQGVFSLDESAFTVQ
ncbi:MAG: glycoside hydrolase family 3 protein [Anaerolineae bacterium]|nr:glycoside hydrolase family 3 protein [Anaerolineae bacterium]